MFQVMTLAAYKGLFSFGAACETLSITRIVIGENLRGNFHKGLVLRLALQIFSKFPDILWTLIVT